MATARQIISALEDSAHLQSDLIAGIANHLPTFEAYTPGDAARGNLQRRYNNEQIDTMAVQLAEADEIARRNAEETRLANARQTRIDMALRLNQIIGKALKNLAEAGVSDESSVVVDPEPGPESESKQEEGGLDLPEPPAPPAPAPPADVPPPPADDAPATLDTLAAAEAATETDDLPL